MPTNSSWIRDRAALAAALLFGCAVGTARAQVSSGEITGLVRDQAAAAVSGATVIATNVATNFSRVTVSTSDGAYTFSGLGPGDYRVDVELNGFKPVRREGITVSTGEKTRVDFALSVGAVREQMTVVADAPPLRTETGSLGFVVDSTPIVQLPLSGRSFITLASLAPGVALPPNSQLPRINGGRPRTNEYLYDGISVLQPEPGQVAFFPIIDAIDQFKVETNSPPAEFGRFNGGVINLTTRSGSNAFHGNGFEFFRNQALNATNYFQTANTEKPKYSRNQFGGTFGGPVVRNRTFFWVDYQGQRQDIDRTITSPVPTLLQRQGIFTEAIAGRMPIIFDPATTVALPGGGFSRTPFLNNTIPSGRIDPVALSLLQRYPLPTSAGTTNNYRRTAGEVDNQDQWDARVDHKLTDSDSVFGRLSYFRDGFIPVTPLPEGSGVTAGTVGPQDTTAWSFASNYQRVFSSHVLNEVRFGETTRAVTRTAAQLATSAGSALQIPGIPSNAQFPNTMPTFLIGGYQQLGSPANTASDFATGVTQIADSLTWVKGSHTFKMGLDWRWERLNVIQPPSPTGQFTFSNLFTNLPGSTATTTGTPLASFLLGQVQTFSIDLQQQQIRERAHFMEFFVQDDWRISVRWTLNPGLRYTLNFPSTEENNQTSFFNLQTQKLEYAGQNGVPESARELHKSNFGPRMGLVGRVTDKTVVSSGYGLIWIEMAGITTPFTTPSFPFLQTTSQRTLDSVTPAFVLAGGPSVAPVGLTPDAGLGQGVFAVDHGLGSGYAQQWNASVQRELSRNTSLTVSYVGSHIVHVGIPDTNLNQLTADQLAIGNPLLQSVPNPYFGIIPRSSTLGDPTISRAQLLKPYPAYQTVSLYRNNVGTTFYQGLEVGVSQRMTRGLTYSASYTRSKLVDDASSVFDASILTGPVANYPVADSFNRKLERDYSTGDIPHLFVGSIVWDLPAGEGRARKLSGIVGALANDWTVTSIVTLQSGVPVAVTQTTNFNSFAGFGTQRPNLVGDPTLPDDERTPAHWFNTAAFTIAPQFTLGSASRNPIRGPSYRNVDFALMRRVQTGHGTGLELRWEIFNLLNAAQFNAPAAVAGVGAFGTITSALDPRVMQLAVKFIF
jgi:hypothetical protein